MVINSSFKEWGDSSWSIVHSRWQTRMFFYGLSIMDKKNTLHFFRITTILTLHKRG